jgi:5,10-methylenetetrahydromethanopterin reductase
LPYIQEGAARAQRDLATVDVAACIWVSIGEDQARAEAVLKEKIADYGHALSPLIWQALGVQQEEFAPIAHAVQVEQNLAKAKALVTPAMLKIGIAGDVQTVITRIEHLVALGVRHLSFGPPLGYDVAAAVTALGKTVIPHFRSIGV